MITDKITQEEIDAQKAMTDHRMKYQVLKSFKDDKGVMWDMDSFVTDVQVSDANAKLAIEADELEVINGVLPEMKIT
jgi:hypothetical protein